MTEIEGGRPINWEARVLKRVYGFSERYHEGIPELTNRVEGVIGRLFGYKNSGETMKKGEMPRLTRKTAKYKDSGFYNG